MFYGADYYPEHWSEDRWELDASLMEDAGINIVRLAEFAWAKIEPRENEYDFSWLDKIIEILSNHKIKIILGTPTATPPKWLIDMYPDILQRDEYGHIRGFGSRRHYCYNSLTYVKYVEKIVTVLAEHYKNNNNIIGWQIDNELGCHDTTVCYCDNCKIEFLKWLKEKYGNIDNLNKSWGTIFWSQIYNNWDSVIIPKLSVTSHNPSLLLDYKRFSSDSVIKYLNFQIDILKKITPNKKITTNFMGLFNQIDYYKLAQKLDFVSWDNYPINNFYNFKEYNSPIITSLSHDVMRGIKNMNFWVMEQQSGATGWEEMSRQLRPNEIKLWVYQSLAHGADAIIYFRWRTCTFGTEEYWHGILDHDGVPRRRYDEVKLIGKELHIIDDIIKDTKVNAKVAIMRSFDNEWAFEIQPHKKGFNYIDQLIKYYRYFYKNNIPVDIINPEDDLTQYKLVLAPGLIMVNEMIFNNIKNYVKNGGDFLTTWRAGAKKWDNRMNDESLLGPFKEILGIDIEEYSVIDDSENVNMSYNGIIGYANTWYDVILPKSARVIGNYDWDYIKSKGAITVNQYGKGTSYYVGTIPSDNIIDALLDDIMLKNNISRMEITADEGVEIYTRENDVDKIYFILNFNSSNSKAVIKNKMYDVIERKECSNEISLNPFGIKILKRLVV